MLIYDYRIHITHTMVTWFLRLLMSSETIEGEIVMPFPFLLPTKIPKLFKKKNPERNKSITDISMDLKKKP